MDCRYIGWRSRSNHRFELLKEESENYKRKASEITGVSARRNRKNLADADPGMIYAGYAS